MANNEKKVIVDVEIKATEALENLAKLKIRVAQLKEEQKVLREEQKISKPTNDEELRAYQEKEFKLAELGQQIKHLLCGISESHTLIVLGYVILFHLIKYRIANPYNNLVRHYKYRTTEVL